MAYFISVVERVLGLEGDKPHGKCRLFPLRTLPTVTWRGCRVPTDSSVANIREVARAARFPQPLQANGVANQGEPTKYKQRVVTKIFLNDTDRRDRLVEHLGEAVRSTAVQRERTATCL